ncbi:hypothetical protein [Streptomyces poriticola]|uniref:hypothetical protein n=1 Tax=Streptomyces poriticola TaxID=3120506 RepID=UPI002FCDFE16
MGDRLEEATRRLTLWRAVVLHRAAAATQGLHQRRNAAVHAAHLRGVPVPELAARLRLSQGRVRTVLRKQALTGEGTPRAAPRERPAGDGAPGEGQPPAVEEAA